MESYCTDCFPNAVFYGKVGKWDLIFCKKSYQIVDGHEVIIHFPLTPLKDPFEGMSEEEMNVAPKELWKEDSAFCEYVGNFRNNFFTFHPQLGQRIFETVLSLGWDPEKDGWMDYWIVNFVAKMISDKKS